jgi:Flp pilus assembly CpaF family ATPase
VSRAAGPLIRQLDGHDLSTPFVDAMLPDGSRLHVVIPQITREHMAVNTASQKPCSSRISPQ